MLLEFRCKNFRSIKEEIVFSMLASSDDTNNDFAVVDILDQRVLKKSILYGANGAGKSNFIKSLLFLKSLVVNSQNHMPNAFFNCQPHKLSNDENTSFLIHFIDRNHTRFVYNLVLNAKRVEEESLYYYPNGRITKIFSRVGLDITTPSYKSQFNFVANQTLKENRLFLSCAAKDSNVAEITAAYTFFNEDLVFYPTDDMFPNDNWKIYSAKKAEVDKNLKDLFVRFNNDLGSKNLVGLESSVKSRMLDEKMIPPFLDEATKKQMLQQQFNEINVNFIYSKFAIRLEEESLGNKKLFEMFFPLIDVIRQGKVFICDEFERSLHPLVVQKLIEIVSRNQTNAQFILTTHDVSLLNPELFRRDEIWFAEMKDQNRSTDIYSLAELKAIRKGELYSRNYILGKYSSIPIISADLKKLLLGENE